METSKTKACQDTVFLRKSSKFQILAILLKNTFSIHIKKMQV